jgi:hypothetical protein
MFVSCFFKRLISFILFLALRQYKLPQKYATFSTKIALMLFFTYLMCCNAIFAPKNVNYTIEFTSL